MGIQAEGKAGMTDPKSYPTQPLVEPLTQREREILAYLGQGLTATEIAQELTLAVSSVRWYIQQVYNKLGVNNKQRALLRAGELGLLAGYGQPPGVTQLPRKHNLPLQITRFFGREAEIEQLVVRLSEERLVTLTGPGGVGKNRLSLRVAGEELDGFEHGVWFVELAPLSDPALVPQQVATSLAQRDEPGRPILEM